MAWMGLPKAEGRTQLERKISASRLPRSQVPLDLDRRSQLWNFYCPLCAVTRTLRYSPEPGKLIHYLRVGICSWLFTLLCFPWFGWKGFVSFVPFWIVFEVIYRLRVRVELRCPECGFDPVLCLSDVKRAKREVELHWANKLGKPIEESSSERDGRPSEKAPDEAGSGRLPT